MGNGAAGAFSSAAAAYVGWKEVFASSDKERREVRYYLKRKDGTSDLAVVGKEKSPRHMTYRYAVQNRFLVGASSSSPLLLKLRSRREVIDWLNYIVSESHAPVSIHNGFGSFDERDAGVLNFGRVVKDIQMQKAAHHAEQILWLGSSWTCKKKWKHYQSFCRNGVKISVNDFVFVLVEENKRLVAHLEDMYEDLEGSKMVVVRWFHRIDEVDIDLPHKFSDREIFFSLCLQDLNIVCIDGIATVLSPQHFDKCLNEVTHSRVQPFVCHRQFDDDNIKPFDITQVKGYWTQEVLGYIYAASTLRVSEEFHQSDLKGLGNCTIIASPRKRLRLLKGSTVEVQQTTREDTIGVPCLNGESNVKNSTCYQKSMVNRVLDEKQPPSFAVGCQVEVLSQDSGLRGCWFRASVVKKHKDKVKVQYYDVQDADDGVCSLEEWVSSSRIAVNDNLGLRISGRTTVRPSPQSHSGRVSWAIDVGALVDAWWHDGWWEGIVVHRESDEKILVYFPGEKREAVFCLPELRHSQEWLGNHWKDLHGRADIAAKILSNLNGLQGSSNACNSRAEMPTSSIIQHACESARDNLLRNNEDCSSNSQFDQSDKKTNILGVLKDLSKDKFLAQLQWKCSRKRSRAGHFVGKSQHSEPKKSTNGLGKLKARRSYQSFLSPALVKLLMVDHENCKFVGDSLFNSSVPPVRSLVMSR